MFKVSDEFIAKLDDLRIHNLLFHHPVVHIRHQCGTVEECHDWATLMDARWRIRKVQGYPS